MKNLNSLLITGLILGFCFLAVSCKSPMKVQIEGEMKVWHTITFTFDGPETSEYDTINPFTDYRLDVEFTEGNQKLTIPGYYAADGNAAQTSARVGQ